MMKEIEAEDPKTYLFFSGERLAIKSPNWLVKEGKR